MKSFNRKMSIFLCIVMILSVFTVVPTATSSAESSEPSLANTYVKVTEDQDDWSGDYLIVYENDNKAFNGGLDTLDSTNNYIDVTINNGEIESDAVTDAAKFTVEAVDGGYSIKSASGYYIGNASNTNALSSDISTEYVNTISVTDGEASITASGGAVLRFNLAETQMRFRYYKTSSYRNQEAIQLYKYTGSTVEPTEPPTEEPTEEPTEAPISGSYIKVTEDQDDWSGDYLIVYESDNKAFNGGLNTLDSTNNYINVTISDGVIESNNKTNAARFTIKEIEGGYSVKSASGYYIGRTSNTNGLGTDTETALVNSISVTDGEAEITAESGAVMRFNAAEDQMRFRYFKTSSYQNQEPVQLYKLTGGSVEPTEAPSEAPTEEPTEAPEPSKYVKVTEDQSDWSGDYLIVYESDNKAFNGGLGTLDSANNYIDVTISNGEIESNAATDAAKFTIAAVNGGYSIKSAGGKYIGRTSNTNGLESDTDTVYVNSISIEDGSAKIAAESGAVLRFNPAENQTRFRYFKSSSYSNQEPVQLYKLSGGFVEPTETPSEAPTEESTELTVYDGDVANLTLPAYFYYFDAYTKSQYVIPAADLQSISGKVISGLKYYVQYEADKIPFTTTTDVDVYVSEVDYTEMSAFADKDSCTAVYHGKLEVVNDVDDTATYTITFDTPYTYNGGNLLIGIDNVEKGEFKQLRSLGTWVDYKCAVSDHSSVSLNDINATQSAFMPKTTLIVNESAPVDPTSVLLGDADGDGEVDILDATLIQRYIAEFNVPDTFNEKAADIDGDGEVSAADSTILLRYLAELAVEYPVNEYTRR